MALPDATEVICTLPAKLHSSGYWKTRWDTVGKKKNAGHAPTRAKAVPYNGCCNRAGKGDPRSPGQKKHSNSHNQIEEKTGAKRPKNQPQGFNMEDQLYPKKGRYFFVFSTQKGFVHNRVPSKQLHDWGCGSLMGYPLEKLFGRCFSIRV